MISKDIEDILSGETKRWLDTISGPNKLAGSHYRVLFVLREVETSPRHLAELTGLSVARVRQRLKQLSERGYVRVVETLSDKTQIWGLGEGMGCPGIPSHPTEPYIAERRMRLSEIFNPEYDPATKTLGKKLDMNKMQAAYFKRFEAKS